MIQPKYFSEKGTPLVYYTILKVLVILWLVVSGANLFIYLLDANLIGVVEMAIQFVIQLFAAIGLYKKQWSGVIMLYCMYAWYILDTFLAMGIYAYYGNLGAGTIAETIGSVIGVLIWAIPTWVYFGKRRPLFAPYRGNVPTVNATPEVACPPTVSEPPRVVREEKESLPPKYCSQCGFKLHENSAYCSQCGTKL